MKNLVYADPMQRLEAYLIDICIYFLGATVSLGVFLIPALINQVIVLILTLILWVGFYFAWYIYIFVYYPYKHNGQTFGKKTMKIRVVYEDGRNLGIWALFARILLVDITSRYIIPVMIAFYSVKKQALHDMLFHTVVIKVVN